MTNPNLYLYVAVRGDMPSQKAGKGAAQATHAGNQFTDEHIIKPLLAGETPNAEAMDWRTQANGFGTTITLDAPSLKDLQAVVAAAKVLGFAADEVVDPEYPYIVDGEIFSLIPDSIHTAPPVRLPDGNYVCFRREVTTAYVFGDKDRLAVLLRRFKLMDNS